MTAFINYLVEATFGLLLLLMFYKAVLAQETHFRFLRLFLLVGILLSVVMPLLHFQVNQSVALSLSKVLPSYWLPEVEFSGSTQPTGKVDISFWSIAGWVYVSGAMGFLFIFLYRFLKLVRLIRTAASSRLENFEIIESNLYAGTFSFFHFIFIEKSVAISEDEKQQIIEHEKVHIREFHSFDILLLNILTIVFWFNPFIRTYKKIFVQLHEFEADARAVERHDTNTYCSLLARVALQSTGFSLANHFNNSLTVKRITMIRTIKKKVSQWKLAIVAMLFPCMVFMLSCQEQVIPQQTKIEGVSEDDQVFLVVEEIPTYPDGLEKMREFISQNMKYPEQAVKDKIEGTVFVEFMIEKNGTISEASTVKGISKECDAEAVRVVKLLSPWNPGMQDGKAVRVKFVLPIKFKL